MTFCEQMIPALSALLEPGETLQAPVYGGILHRRSCTYGYFGLTDQALLVALLQGSTKAIAGNSRVPFAQIRTVRVRRSLVPFQYIVTFYLQDEEEIRMRISRKVYGFAEQAENLECFLATIQTIL